MIGATHRPSWGLVIVRLLAVALMLPTGCVMTKHAKKTTEVEVLPPKPASKHKAAWHQGSPSKMMVMATQSHLESDGIPKFQGMLCRVYFFEGEDPTPLKVKGRLTFSAFDPNKETEEGKPSGIFTIPPEEMAAHERKDVIGDSYVFWLPYSPDRPTQLSVEACFTPTKGGEFKSSIVTVDLEPLNTISEIARKNAKEGKKTANGKSAPVRKQAKSLSSVEVVEEDNSLIVAGAGLRPAKPTQRKYERTQPPKGEQAHAN